MQDIMIGLVILMILGAAALYVYKAKKRGQKCIGCPAGGCCAQKGCCSCGKQ